MIQRHSVFLTIVLILCVSLSYVMSVDAKDDFSWEQIKHNGQEYVSLRSLKTFYFFDKITFGSKITLENKSYKMIVKSGSQECRLNGVLFILSHPIVSKDGRYLLHYTDLVKLIDPVFRPASIPNANAFNSVVVDAGHGGHDSGAKGIFGSEKVYTLKLAKLLRDQLQARGYKVIMTRATDVFVSRSNRVAMANRFPNAIFISLHFNSAHSAAKGVETFTVSPVGVPHLGRGVRDGDYRSVPGNIADSASIALATAVHGRALLYLNDARNGNNFRMIDRGIKRARFDVLQGIKIPAVLFEGGFLSNREEAAKVNSLAFQKTLAAALVKAVDVYRGAILKGGGRGK